MRRYALALPLVLAAAFAAPKVTSVRAVPASAPAGSRVTVHVTARPRTARLRVLLRHAGRADVALRRVVRHGAKVTGTIPASTRAGTYRVRACPRVRHPRCATAKRRLEVLAVGSPAPAPGVAPPQPTETPDPGPAIPRPIPTPNPGPKAAR